MKENFPETFKSQLEKNKNVIYRAGSVRVGKNCALGLSSAEAVAGPRAVLRPRAQFLPIRTDPGRWITYMFLLSIRMWSQRSTSSLLYFVCEKPKLLYLIIKKSSKWKLVQVPSYLLLLPFVWFSSRFLLFKVFLCFALYVYLSIFPKKKKKHKYYFELWLPKCKSQKV